MQKEADEVAQAGRTPYLIPGGASNAIGALGYVNCAQELQAQLLEQEIVLDHIIVPSGSSGTQAGMVTGLQGTNTDIPVSGICVSREKTKQEALVFSLVEQTAEKLGLSQTIPRQTVILMPMWGRVFNSHRGDGGSHQAVSPNRRDLVRPGVFGQNHGRLDRFD